MSTNKRVRRSLKKPSTVLDDCRVLSYAFIVPPISFSGHSSLFVNGTEIGPVPRLAIAEQLHYGDLLVLHCDIDWNVIGVAAGYKSVAKAKRQVERIYPGIRGAWVDSSISKRQALACERKMWKGHECSFCNKIPPQFTYHIKSKKATICDICIRKFYEIINKEEANV